MLARLVDAGRHAVAAAEENTLVGLIKLRRRALPPEKVAHYKAVHGVAVEDIEREQAVLAGPAHTLSASYGLQADDARQFFVHQIEANKWIQFSLLADWR